MIPADALAALEDQVREALSTRDVSQLNILGFGELSVALGWPADAPRVACKRTPPFTRQQLAQYSALVERYIADLRVSGVLVTDTEVMSVPSDARQVGYLVQPLLAAEGLGGNVLRASPPDSDHPFLAAVATTLAHVTPQLSIDAQITNWWWNDCTLTLVDVGTPFVWDASGASEFDMTPFLAMIPAPLRALVRRDMAKVTERWKTTGGVATDVVANLWREGLDEWVDPTITALNRALDARQQVHRDTTRSFYEDDLKTWPRLKRLQQAERAWRTRIRRSRYDFFIQNSFDGTIR
ncbi:MAG: DUF6206 family protein [Actinomycetota bacterium]|nr:DUF6206 family protein [Actinomycetota bacterium]